MPWFYILVSINKHCDTWLVSECLPVEKLWLMTCSFKKETSVGVALGCNHPEITFTLVVWICRWILNKVTDKMRHYRCVVTGGKWWNSAEEMVGVCLVVQCMLYEWVCAFDLVMLWASPRPHACFWIKWHCLLAACFSNQIGKKKKIPTKELNDVELYRLGMSSIKCSKYLTS